MCVANVIFGQEHLTEQFLSMHFLWQRYSLYKTVLISKVNTMLSTRSFCESILFVHLIVLRGGELRLVRTVGMVGFDKILFETLSKKWH